jgi:O-methyltransferase
MWRSGFSREDRLKITLVLSVRPIFFTFVNSQKGKLTSGYFMFAKKVYYSFSSMLSKRHLHVIRSLEYLNRKKKISLDRLDYIRLSTLELCSHEIYEKGVQGNVAELGVYKGDFAKEINAAFHDRKLYLFDTFEGFDKRDVATEVGKGFSSGTQDFSDTSVETVLSKMYHKENCIVCKGFFPNSAKGIEDRYCFVSIDADLYEPILAGLEYFYPRLEAGGYIFVHDFNNEEYKGARKAVIEFCNKNKVAYLPVGDIGGTAIISK